MKRAVPTFLFLLIPLLVLSADTVKQKAERYVALYSELAVSEMYRSGIPASIILGQALLESGCGCSTLAVKSNNHFGIKCHADWKGERVYHDDDIKDDCFRKYPSVLDSYIDHSDFLRFKPRYAFLFDYRKTDYKSWAHGLKKAGYATDPQYAYKLINIIETYDLSRFDKAKPKAVAGEGGRPAEQAEVTMPPSPSELEAPTRFTGSGKTGTFAVSLHREVLERNGVPFIYAREGETYRSIAALYDLFPKELMGFNEEKADRALAPGEVVYLQHKAKHAVKGLEKHICSDGETLRGISQKYAVSLRSLMKMNGIKNADDYIVREDNTLYLRPVKKDRT